MSLNDISQRPNAFQGPSNGISQLLLQVGWGVSFEEKESSWGCEKELRGGWGAGRELVGGRWPQHGEPGSFVRRSLATP